MTTIKVQTQSPGRWVRFLLLIAFALGTSLQAQAQTNRAPGTVRVVLVGDSTVTDHAGWGLGFKQSTTNEVECINTARGGRSSKSFTDEGHWEKALTLQGDYYLIQFGHNDQPGKGPKRETDPATTYAQNMTRYVEEVQAIGGTPVLVTSLVRRKFDPAEEGQINSTLVPYVEAVKQVAAEKQVALIDLHAYSKEQCEKLGREKCYEFSPVKEDGSYDTTHLNAEGSVFFAMFVVTEFRKVMEQ